MKYTGFYTLRGNMETPQVTETVDWCIKTEMVHVKTVEKFTFPYLVMKYQYSLMTHRATIYNCVNLFHVILHQFLSVPILLIQPLIFLTSLTTVRYSLCDHCL